MCYHYVLIIGAATVLDINTHLQPVYTAIYEARSKWKNIGRSLNVSGGTIASIRDPDDGECLHACAHLLIQTGKAVTKDLLGVLENKTVGRQDIAKEIRDLQGSDHSDVGL